MRRTLLSLGIAALMVVGVAALGRRDAREAEDVPPNVPPPPEWGWFQPSGYGLRFLALGEPVLRRTTVPGPGGPVTVDLFQTTHRGASYVVMVSPLTPLSLSSGDESALGDAKAGALRNARASLVSEADLTVEGRPAKSILCQAPGSAGAAQIKSRMVIDDDRLIVLSVTGPAGTVEAPPADLFLSSLGFHRPARRPSGSSKGGS